MENRAEHLIEAYFANELSPAEKAELKKLVSDDPKVAAELNFQQSIAKRFQKASIADSIENPAWRAAGEKPFPHNAIKASFGKRYMYAAAAVFALLIAAYLFLRPSGLQSTLADNSREYPNKMRFKSMGDEAEKVAPNIIKAFDLYDLKQFDQAAQALAPIVAAEPNRTDYRLYWGVSLLKSGQYEAAISALQPIAVGNDERRLPAYFYLGIAYAAHGDYTPARQYLEAYVNATEGVTFRTQAQNVLDALDKQQ